MRRALVIVTLVVASLTAATVFAVGIPLVRATARVDEHSAAIMSAPLVGCEPMDITVLRLESHRGQSSWMILCLDKKFICGQTKSPGGHTILCNQTNCFSAHEPQERGGKTKV